MSEIKTLRLSKIAKEFNLSIATIVDFLSSKGHKVENNPNAKIGDIEYSLISKEFVEDKKLKQEFQKNTKEKHWITTDKRFVVFLDIMGFKDFVSRKTHSEVYEMMTSLSKSKEAVESFLDEEIGNKEEARYLYTTSFSDSLILFSKDDTPFSFSIITACASFIIAEAIKDSIPMKGAIAHGIISVNKAQQIYFGQPLIDAYLLQEDVNYYGIVSHHSVDSYLLNEIELDNSVRKEYVDIKTPLKSGIIKHYNINWFTAIKDKNNEEIESCFLEAIKKLKTITSGAPRKYIDNTVDVFNSIYPKV